MATIRTLASLTKGTRARIVGINGGWGAQRRLYEMGLYPGSEIIVMENTGIGPVIISNRNGRFAIGRGIAMKIMVEVLQ